MKSCYTSKNSITSQDIEGTSFSIIKCTQTIY
nr:MAG TPA: hypothetical protein [Caudoviricetes sp.]